MRKTVFFVYAKNKGADQLRGNHKADQCLCFRYIQRSTTAHSIFYIIPTYLIMLYVCSGPHLSQASFAAQLSP